MLPKYLGVGDHPRRRRPDLYSRYSATFHAGPAVIGPCFHGSKWAFRGSDPRRTHSEGLAKSTPWNSQLRASGDASLFTGETVPCCRSLGIHKAPTVQLAENRRSQATEEMPLS